jgi:HlyD family type I secretion membrane fusion protein
MKQIFARLKSAGDNPREDTSGGDKWADTSGPIRIGMILIAVTFIGFGGWASVAPIAQGAVASGRIIVESQRKSIQHLEGGIIRRILVRDGDMVEEGQTLVELEDTRSRAQNDIVSGQLHAYRALEARLLAERDGLQEVNFPASLQDASDNPETRKVMEGQRDLFEARRTALEGQKTILVQRMGQLEKMAAGLRSQIASKNEQLVYLNEEIRGLQKLYEQGHAPKARLLALQRAASEAEGERGKHLADLASAQLRIGETKLEVIQAEKAFREQVIEELRATQERISDLSEQARAATDVLERTQIRAPVAGTIVGLEVHTEGGVINPSETVLEIVPRDRRLIVQARVQTQDIDLVSANAETEVRLLPFKQRTLPILLGRVTSVSADMLEDERTGEVYYAANVEIPPLEMAKLEGQTLVPGMPADVIIKAGEATALQYILSPLSDAFARSFKE